ncbi:hypothetical protein V6Z12_D07G065000 [Gossypium hirsutum]
MVRVSNSIVVFVNTMLLLLGLISLFLGIYFVIVNNGSNSSSHCRKVLTNPLLILGGFLATVSFCFMFVYLGVMLLCLIGFTVFVFLITNNDAGKVFSEKEFFVKERKTMDFSHWLQNHFVNDKNWNRIKSCLIDARVCTSGRNANGVNYNLSLQYRLSVKSKDKILKLKSKINPENNTSVEGLRHSKVDTTANNGGCCNPPSSCGFKPKNTTFWEVPKSGAATSDPDCKTWRNNPWELCYDCNSCNSGILANLRKEWRSLAFINIILVVFLFFVYSIGCCARRGNHKTNNKYIRGFA